MTSSWRSIASLERLKSEREGCIVNSIYTVWQYGLNLNSGTRAAKLWNKIGLSSVDANRKDGKRWWRFWKHYVFILVHVKEILWNIVVSWGSHDMGTLSSLQTLCKGNPPVTGGFPSQKPVMQSFDIFFISTLTNSRIAGDLRQHDAHVLM